MIDLAKLKAAALAATPGPWAVCEEPANPTWLKGRSILSVPELSRICDVNVLRHDEGAFADARLIAACDPQTILALVRIAEAAAAYINSKGWACVQYADLIRALRDAGLLEQSP